VRRGDEAGAHRQLQHQLLAGGEDAPHGMGTGGERRRGVPAIDPRGVLEPRPVGPCRHAQRQLDLVARRREDTDPHRAVVRVVGRDLDREVLAVHLCAVSAARVQVQLQPGLVGRRDVLVEAGQGAHDVRRAAGAVEPAAPTVRDRAALVGDRALAQLQRVHVEELSAGEGDAGQDGVVQQAVDRIGEGLVARGEQQPPSPLDSRDARARLRVAAVRAQLEGVAEGLPVPARPHPAGHIGLGGERRREQTLLVGEELGVVVLDREVRRPGGEIERAHRVPLDRRRLPHRHTVREVARARILRGRGVPAALEEGAREVQGVGSAGLAMQLDQGHLDLGMTRDAVVPAGAEHPVEVVQDPQRHLQQRVIAGAAGLGDGGLHEVAVAVQLVVPGEVGVPLLAGVAQLVDAVEVSVLLLRRGDGRGDVLHEAPQLGVVLAPQLEGHGLEPLKDVRVLEDHAAGLALGGPGGDPEVRQRAGGLELLVPRAQGVAPVALLTQAPESAVDAGGARCEGGADGRGPTGVGRTGAARAGAGRAVCAAAGPGRLGAAEPDGCVMSALLRAVGN
jgi:hypothetical protein